MRSSIFPKSNPAGWTLEIESFPVAAVTDEMLKAVTPLAKPKGWSWRRMSRRRWSLKATAAESSRC